MMVRGGDGERWRAAMAHPHALERLVCVERVGSQQQRDDVEIVEHLLERLHIEQPAALLLDRRQQRAVRREPRRDGRDEAEQAVDRAVASLRC